MSKGLKAWAKESEAMTCSDAPRSTLFADSKKSADSKGNFQRLAMDENDITECCDGDHEANNQRGDIELTVAASSHRSSNDADDYDSLPPASTNCGSGDATPLTEKDNHMESSSSISNSSNSGGSGGWEDAVESDNRSEDGDSLQALKEWVASKQTEHLIGGERIELANNSVELGATGGGGGSGGDGSGGNVLSIQMSPMEIKHAALAIIEGEERHHPLWKIGFLVSCFIGVMFMDYMKDLEECGTPSFWLWTGLVVPWTFGYTLAYRRFLTRRHALKLKLGYEFVEGDVMWGARETLLYPVCCTAAGILAGLFGVGGGMIKGPLVLEMGLTPLQAHATGMFMILFTSGSACITFYFFGQLK